MNKKRFLKITRCNSNQYMIVTDIRDILDDIKEAEIGDTFSITIIEMTNDEFSSINEFEEW